MDKTFPVMEIFGPTMQGEGAMAGYFTYFVRFGGCDFRCWWCDSGFSVIPAEVKNNATKLSAGEIVDELGALTRGPKWVTLSGGNPALLDLGELIDRLHDKGYKVAIETQGSVFKEWFGKLDQLTISPKPPSSGMSGKLNSALQQFLMDWYGTRAALSSTCFKIPVFDNVDYEYAMAYHKGWPNIPFYLSVVTRMGGLYGDFDGGTIDTKDDILARYRWLVERASEDPRASDVKAFPQLHALIWGHTRGV
jgi:7-carboxy-7-deazaguanine synthase